MKKIARRAGRRPCVKRRINYDGVSFQGKKYRSLELLGYQGDIVYVRPKGLRAVEIFDGVEGPRICTAKTGDPFREIN